MKFRLKILIKYDVQYNYLMIAKRNFFKFMIKLIYNIFTPTLAFKPCYSHQKMRKDESSVARQAMQGNHLDGIGSRKGRPCETWRRTVARESKDLNKTWSDMKQLAQSRVRCRVGVVDALCPSRDQGKKKKIDIKLACFK